MTKRRVRVTQWVDVEMDDAKFDDDFMSEFTASFFPYDTLTEHARHLAQLFARGVVDGFKDEFIEGYGPASEMGITFTEVDLETECETPVPA